MIQDELKTEAEVRRFLLGGLSDDERIALEEKFVADENFFEQIRVVEDELIESYVRETLTPNEKEEFERSFLNTERRRNRVEITRSMLKKLSESKTLAASKKTETANISAWDSIAAFLKNPIFALGAALAVLLLTLSGWLLLRSSNRQEIAQQITPTPTGTVETIQSDSNKIAGSNQAAPNSNLNPPERIEANKNNSGQKNETTNKNSNALNSNEQKEKPITINPVFVLISGTVRSDGKTQELNLPENAGTVSMQLRLDSVDYKIYRAEIVDADGNTIAGSGKLKPQNSRINFFVPAGRLRRGDYIVRLSALNPQNESESVADYTFRIIRK